MRNLLRCKPAAHLCYIREQNSNTRFVALRKLSADVERGGEKDPGDLLIENCPSLCIPRRESSERYVRFRIYIVYSHIHVYMYIHRLRRIDAHKHVTSHAEIEGSPLPRAELQDRVVLEVLQ